MKKITALTLLLALALASCGGTPTKTYELYENGTKATYQIFIDDSYAGTVTYTFLHEELEGKPILKILSESDYKYLGPGNKQATNIRMKTETTVAKDDWRPIQAYFRSDYDGLLNGFHETTSKYGDHFVSWVNKSPNGSTTKEVKFFEQYLDEDEVLWYAPTLGYKEDYKKLFTYFANRTAEPTQGMIWMGGQHKIQVRGKTYDSWAAGLRCNEIVQRVWYDMETGRLLRFEQDMGFLSYPTGDPRKREAGYEPPKVLFSMVLDSWEVVK